MIRQAFDDGLAVVTIDRPDKLNALTLTMRKQLRDAFALCQRDDRVRAVLLRASGERAFCTGADVAELDGNDTRRDFDEVTNPLVLHLHRLDKPVVCAVNGTAVGLGWSLALACDLVVAARRARFSQVFRNVGLAPDGGATWFLSRLVGIGQAKALAFSARFVEADEALQLGLVHEVVADDALAARALAVARDLAAGPTLAFAATKRLLSAAVAPPLAEHLAAEADAQCALTRSADHRDALAAFAGKRKPAFHGC
jgi:2-(1,2-epoxy-1,2-dihydrophenyl)acetyl-CoA isomerase